MAETNGESKGSSKNVFIVLGAVAAVLAGTAYVLHLQAEKTLTELDRSIADYNTMVNMKRSVETIRRRRQGLPLKDQGDPLQFLSVKARQAQIPSNLFNVARNSEITGPEWKETPYTVTLRAGKDAPVSLAAIADFLRLVEDERPSIRSKNLNLGYLPETVSFSNVSLTLSSFQRK